MMLSEIIRMPLLMLIICAFAYQAFALFCVWEFLRRNRCDGRCMCEAPISIIKPLKGWDPEFAANIRSLCEQDYPLFEVLLGVADAEDEALPRLREIAAVYDNCRVIVSMENYGTNKKVSNLQGLAEAASYQLLAISDSDMRVDRFYLRDIVQEYYEHNNAGLVTCLYKTSFHKTTGAAMESLTTALDFIPSVLVARRLEGITFGLGASLLVSKDALESIGGLPAIANHLADDYQIGNRLWKQGYKLVLSRVVVENVVEPMSISDYWLHQVRWARTYRASRPLGYLGHGVRHLFPFTLFFALFQGPTVFALCLIGASLCLRLGLALIFCAKEIRSKAWLKWLVLLPVKDVAGFCIWVWSFMSNKIMWRKTVYTIKKDGTMMVEASHKKGKYGSRLRGWISATNPKTQPTQRTQQTQQTQRTH